MNFSKEEALSRLRENVQQLKSCEAMAAEPSSYEQAQAGRILWLMEIGVQGRIAECLYSGVSEDEIIAIAGEELLRATKVREDLN